jgi:hypothetical protein
MRIKEKLEKGENFVYLKCLLSLLVEGENKPKGEKWSFRVWRKITKEETRETKKMGTKLFDFPFLIVSLCIVCKSLSM